MSKKVLNTEKITSELSQSKFFASASKPKSGGKRKDNRKDLSKDLNVHTNQDVKKDVYEPTNQLPTADEVEVMVFRMRKASKVRVNGDMPEDWKKALDEYAHQAGVGRYHLVMYAVGKMLGKV